MKKKYFILQTLFAAFFFVPGIASGDTSYFMLTEKQDSMAIRKAFEKHYERISRVNDSLLSCEERIDKYELQLFCFDHFYVDEEGMDRTKLTLKDFLDKGYSPLYYEQLIKEQKVNNESKVAQMKLGVSKSIIIEGWKEAKERYDKTERSILVERLEKAKKEKMQKEKMQSDKKK